MKVFIGIVLSLIAINTFSKDIDTVVFTGVVSLDSYFSESDPLFQDASIKLVESLTMHFEKEGGLLINPRVQTLEIEDNDSTENEVEEDIEAFYSIAASFLNLDDGMPAILLVLYTPQGESVIETVGVFVTLEDVQFIVEDFYFEIQSL